MPHSSNAKIRFSANVSMLFTELEPLDRIAAAARAGFDAVEWQFPHNLPLDEIRVRADALGLAVNHVNTSAGNPGEFGLAAQPGREEDFFRALDQALESAVKLGCLTIHCMSGCVAEGQTAHARQTFLQNMAKANIAARSANVTLCIEPINTRDRPGYFVSRSDEIVELLQQIGGSHVKLLFDFYHIQIMEGDLLQRMERHWPYIGHFQFASVPSRNEPDRGEVNYAAIFAAIAQRGWTGFAGAEYRPAGRTQDGLGWLKTLAPA